ncbi:MAG TPA: hypothetical protein VF178_03680 [Gemmatimonadaceae bacterium]
MSQKSLGQYMTPCWAAEELIEQYFADLTSSDQVCEPSCGDGAFLRAIPDNVPAFGVEIDPVLAARAREHSGRPVIVGDFRAADLPVRPTAIVGNPPFSLTTIEGFFDRAWTLLPDGGRVGFILPCYTFQTASTVARLAERWSIRQDMVPRNLFSGLSLPLCFAVLTKGRTRNLFGFALYHETHAVSRLQRRYRELLSGGEGNVWMAVTRAALEALGGAAQLQTIYREIEGNRPTEMAFWKAKVRQCLQRIAVGDGHGRWELPTAAPALVLAA